MTRERVYKKDKIQIRIVNNFYTQYNLKFIIF